MHRLHSSITVFMQGSAGSAASAYDADQKWLSTLRRIGEAQYGAFLEILLLSPESVGIPTLALVISLIYATIGILFYTEIA